jgi:hypothetical protein
VKSAGAVVVRGSTLRLRCEAGRSSGCDGKGSEDRSSQRLEITGVVNSPWLEANHRSWEEFSAWFWDLRIKVSIEQAKMGQVLRNAHLCPHCKLQLQY